MFDMIGRVGVGVGGVEGLLGRMGVGGEDGWFSSMLTIELHVRDTNNYVKYLGISHNAAVLEKVRDVPIYFSRLLEKVREITIQIFHI